MKLLKQFLALGIVFFCLAGNSLGNQNSSAQRRAERWEDIAKMRLQIAKDYEAYVEGAFTGSSASSSDAVGDMLELYGDKKVLASDNYDVARQHWDSAAKDYKLAGDSLSVKKAREGANTAAEASKRALTDAVYFHMKAKEQFESRNNLEKKTRAYEKAVKNLERLMR